MVSAARSAKRRQRSGRARPAVRSRFLVLVAALMTFLMSAVQLVNVAHMILVVHAECPVHGDLMHVEDTVSDASPALDAAVPQDEDRAAPATAQCSPDDHCDTVASRQAAAMVVHVSVETTLLDGYLLPWSVRPLLLERVDDRLHLAPKNSPPL